MLQISLKLDLREEWIYYHSTDALEGVGMFVRQKHAVQLGIF